MVIGNKHASCLLQANAFHIIINGFPGKHPEYPMKMKGGEMGYLRKILKAMLLIQVGIYVIDYPVDALEIFFPGLQLYARQVQFL